MRNSIFGLAFVLLAGCAMSKHAAEPSAPTVNPITGSEIAQSTLPAAPAGGSAIPAAAKPTDGRPEDLKPDAAKPTLAKPVAVAPSAAEPAATDPAVVVPAAMISPEEIACVRAHGSWGTAGRSGAHTCIYSTKDGGKSCSKEDDCEGVCLARSKTCAPVRPLFGCNDILQNDGVLATLCID